MAAEQHSPQSKSPPSKLLGALALAVSLTFAGNQRSHAQLFQSQSSSFLSAGQAQASGLAPINLHSGDSYRFQPSSNLIAQSAPPQFVPTDVTPFAISGERSTFTPGYKFRVFQYLPARLWFNSTTEVSQRIDTNVFFTYSHPKFDYAFRALPNITVGYNVLKNTSVYCNYFVIKDTFAQHPALLNFPTTMSLSMGVRQDFPVGKKTNIQLDFQARELWQTSHLHQFDFIPALNITHVVNPNHIFFGSTLLQLRGREYFAAPTREIDPFYTVGYVYRRGKWTFVANDTLVTNFRSPPFHGSIPRQGNVTMIADLELSRPVVNKFPALVAFVRAEPIWNWSSHKAPGLSGFDFRLFTGLRLSLNKPTYFGAIEKLREQLLESESVPKPPSISTRPAGMRNAAQQSNQRGDTAQPAPTAQAPQLILPPWEAPMKTFIHQSAPAPLATPIPAPSVSAEPAEPPVES
jgi:hypothetical protein